MGKGTDPVRAIATKYVSVLDGQIDVEQVISIRMREQGEEALDTQLLVISPSFEGMSWTDRTDLLAIATLKVLPDYIVAWGFTPRELEMHRSGERRELFLAHALTESREVYHKAPAGSGTAG